MLRVLTYVIAYKLFWNWIDVVQFISHEIWFDKVLIMQHFLHYCLVQNVLLQSLSIGVRIIFNHFQHQWIGR